MGLRLLHKEKNNLLSQPRLAFKDTNVAAITEGGLRGNTQGIALFLTRGKVMGLTVRYPGSDPHTLGCYHTLTNKQVKNSTNEKTQNGVMHCKPFPIQIFIPSNSVFFYNEDPCNGHPME